MRPSQILVDLPGRGEVLVEYERDQEFMDRDTICILEVMDDGEPVETDDDEEWLIRNAVRNERGRFR